MNYETYLSTKQQTSEEKTRFSDSDADPVRSTGPESPAEKRAQETGSLGSYAFPKRVRLTRRPEFQKVYRNGARVSGRHLVVFAVENDLDRVRMGVTASKKTGNAVRRARAKRRIRELFRMEIPGLREDSFDMVVNIRWSCADAPWPELAEDFQKALLRLRRKYRNSQG